MWTYNFLGIGLLILQLFNNAVCGSLNIMPSKEEQTKFIGNSFLVGCESDSKNVQRVMWTGPNGKQITNYLDRVHVEDGASGHEGVDLVFEKIDSTDKGNYTCSANVDGKEVQKSFSLEVLKPITFEGTDKVQFLEEGSDSHIKCNVDGDPIPKVSWQYKGVFIKPDKDDSAEKYTQSPENPFWIVVKNSSIKDSGKYICSAQQLTKSISQRERFFIDVKVRHKPIEVKSEHVNESYSYVTGVVNLTCEVIAEPIANFTWAKDDVTIVPSKDVKIFTEDQRSILQLMIVNEEMFGDYICQAKNRLGTLKRVVSLEKGIKPSIPKTKIKTIKERELHLNLSSKGQPNMPITGYKVEFKRPGEDWEGANSTEFKYGDPYILDGLNDDTLYVIRVTSRNVAGYSEPSRDLMEKTSKSMPINDKLNGSVPLSTPLPLCTLLVIVMALKLSIVS